MDNTEIKVRLTFRTAAVAAAFLVIFILIAATVALKKTNTWDEPAHILAGYAYLKKGADYLSPLNHPVLGRSLTALLPAAALDLDFNPAVRPEEAEKSDFFPYSVRFLYGNKAPAEKILFLSRLPVILLGTLLGIFVFLWSTDLWGIRGGVLSLFFYILSPDIIAHSSLATTDMPVAAFFFITVFCLYRLAGYGVSVKRIILTAVFFALALTSKHTALLIFPVLAAAFIINLRKEPARRVALNYALLVFLVYVFIWAIYGFRFKSPGQFYEPLLWQRFPPSWFSPVFSFFRRIHFLPEAYLYSLNGTLAGSGAGRSSFLMGEYSVNGWRYYFLAAFLIKTPVATILFLAAAVLYLSKERAARALWVLLPALLIFTAVSMQKVNIGLRHVLPAYPFIFTLIGFVPCIKTESRKAARTVFYGACLWYLYAAASIYPHELAYFNEFIGGPRNGYKYLVDSNLDWGQDLKGLKSYMDEKKIDVIKLGYFGLADPAYFGIRYEYLPSFMIFNPQNVKEKIPLEGWFAVSATMLQGVYMADRDYYKPLREAAPVDTIGYSIFIYRFDKPSEASASKVTKRP